MRHALIAVIRAYQRYVSPHKSYGCAYRLVHGGSGCSGVGLRLVRRFGVWHGLRLLRQRFIHCQHAHQQRLASLRGQSGAIGCEEALCCGAGDAACSGLCGRITADSHSAPPPPTANAAQRHQRGHCDLSCCDLAGCCGDFPLPRLLDEWVAEHKTLAAAVIVFFMLLAMVIFTHG